MSHHRIWPVPKQACQSEIVVSMIDVDRYQIHFTAYYGWMDRAYHRLLQQAGVRIRDLLDAGVATPAVRSECDYLHPVHVDDRLTLWSWVTRIGRSSFQVRHQFADELGRVVAQGSVTHVYVDGGSAMSLPGWLRRLRGEDSSEKK